MTSRPSRRRGQATTGSAGAPKSTGSAPGERAGSPGPADPTAPIQTVRSDQPARTSRWVAGVRSGMSAAAAREKGTVRREPVAKGSVLTGLIPIWLYGLAAVLLLAKIGDHPPYAYNWENYTAWGMFRFWDDLAGRDDLFRMSDGLMTDSGEGPLMVLPIWLGWNIFGVGIEGLRVPIVLIAALAAPLTWLVGRRTVGPGAAGIGATLLALSPVFLLYGRTATLVGISLVPALATIYALLRVLRPERERFGAWVGWLAALQVLLVADSYAYAVIRFLWLIALILLAGEVLVRRGARMRFAAAFGVTAVVLPLALLGLGARDGFSAGPGEIDETLRRYYNGRGEQIVSLNDDPGGYRYFLEDGSEVSVETESTEDLAWRLIVQNAKDYLDLHLDRNTLPAITDYWNPRGRLLPQAQVPFFLLGLVVLLAVAWRPQVGAEARAMLALYGGLGVPLFLTSRVHIGRLIFAVPLLCLIVGLGVVALFRAGQLGAAVLTDRTEGGSGRWRALASPAVVLALILIGVTASDTWADYTISPRSEPQRGWALTMEAHVEEARAVGGAVLVMPSGLGAEIEGVDAAGTRLIAGDTYRYINLREPAPDPKGDDNDPPLYYGNLLGLLEDSPERVPNRCDMVYFIRPDAEEEFNRVTNGGRIAGCAEPVRVVVLG